ncbi:hypothetical protein QQF64_009224 [Cirrhinus molitorella]|uniref:Uncharacterized protein n=1 Tax=Cirrhinus molitorella TaxID=172907 RepID=A0ABR3M0K7_9TELE
MCQELQQFLPPIPKTCINPLLRRCHRSFLVQAKYRSETRLFEAATWQPDENNPAQEESIHVIMRTHVACVKIKPYSSPAACSSASVHHRYGTDSARNAGEVPRISHAPQIGGTRDAEVWRSGIASLPPPPARKTTFARTQSTLTLSIITIIIQEFPKRQPNSHLSF